MLRYFVVIIKNAQLSSYGFGIFSSKIKWVNKEIEMQNYPEKDFTIWA